MYRQLGCLLSEMLGGGSCIATFSDLEAGLSSGAIPVDDSRALACWNTGHIFPGNVIKMKPPMVLTEDDVDMAVRVFDNELSQLDRI